MKKIIVLLVIIFVGGMLYAENSSIKLGANIVSSACLQDHVLISALEGTSSVNYSLLSNPTPKSERIIITDENYSIGMAFTTVGCIFSCAGLIPFIVGVCTEVDELERVGIGLLELGGVFVLIGLPIFLCAKSDYYVTHEVAMSYNASIYCTANSIGAKIRY